VLASALVLERRVIERRADADEQRRQEGVFRCEITRFMLVFGLERGRKVFGGEGDGGEGENGGGSGEGDRTMTESQARDTVQVLKRVRLTVNGNDRHSTLSAICNRFEAMVDVYVARSKGKSNVWRTDGLPDADPERAKTDEEIERKNRCQAAEQRRLLLGFSASDEWEHTDPATPLFLSGVVAASERFDRECRKYESRRCCHEPDAALRLRSEVRVRLQG
jgi:hypothetical protein